MKTCFVAVVLTAASVVAGASGAQEQNSQRWLKCNTHTHTASFPRSDADTPPLEVARWYKLHGYQCLVITDHEHLTDIAPVNAELADGNFLVIAGQEVTQVVKDRTHPEGRRHAHVNGIGMTKPVLPLGFPADFQWSNPPTPGFPLYAGWEGGTVPETFRRNVDQIRAQGAVPQINHPNGEFSVLFEHLEDLDGPYLMEIHGAASLGGVSDTGEIALPVETLWDQLLTSGKSVWGVASDDAHQYRTDGSGVSDAGKGWIMIQSVDLTREAVMAALRDGRFYASDGVTIRTYEVTDEAIDIQIDVPRVRNTEKLVADRFRTEFIGPGGAVLATVHGAHPRYERKGYEPYVRAVITNSHGRKAWTQPVFRTRPQ
jgi:hypothetical protein